MADRPTGTSRVRLLLAGLALVGALLAFAPGYFTRLRATQGALATFVRVLEAGNTQDIATLRSLCSRRFLVVHPPRPAEEGGVVGLPRNIHKNFRAWCDGPDVLLCPTNRVGPVYRLVREEGTWKFDGLAGRLVGAGHLELLD